MKQCWMQQEGPLYKLRTAQSPCSSTKHDIKVQFYLNSASTVQQNPDFQRLLGLSGCFCLFVCFARPG